MIQEVITEIVKVHKKRQKKVKPVGFDANGNTIIRPMHHNDFQRPIRTQNFNAMKSKRYCFGDFKEFNRLLKMFNED